MSINKYGLYARCIYIFTFALFCAGRMFCQGAGTSFCGVLVHNSTIPDGAPTYYDRFGNKYSEADLNPNNYPNAQYLEDCNSGIFLLQFVAESTEPAWTVAEMETACAVFNYLSGLVATFPTLAPYIIIQLNKGQLSPSTLAAATPLWTEICGISDPALVEAILTGQSTFLIGQIVGFITIASSPYTGGWHTLAEDCGAANPCVANNEADLYSVLLHEGLHLLGFSSLIGLSGAPIISGIYSRWDEHLYSTNQNAPLISPQPSAICCDRHVFNATSFSNMPANLSGDCAMNVFFREGSTNIGEVNFATSVPQTSPQMANKLSHLDNTCTQGAQFVMNPTLASGTNTRVLAAQEIAILCRLGYQGGGCTNTCPVKAHFDGPYTLTLSQASSITIAVSTLLENDVFLQTPTVSFCGSEPGMNVVFNNVL